MKMHYTEWRKIEGLPGEWRALKFVSSMRVAATAVAKGADDGMVKVLGAGLRSARSYAKRIEDEAESGRPTTLWTINHDVLDEKTNARAKQIEDEAAKR
jgi:hypothetical protein